MADAEGPRLEGRKPTGVCGTDGCSTKYGLPLFAPGRNATDTWREILAADPTLEPAICGMVDGMAHRVDRLRLCGNGVVPLQAAFAFVVLAADLIEN